MLNSFYTTVNS